MAKKLLLAFLIILGASLIAFLAWFCFQYFAKQQASVPAYFSSLTVGEEATFDTDKSAKSAEVFSSSLTENFALLKTKETPSRSSSSASSPLLPPSLPLEVLAPPPSLMDIDKGDYLPRIAADGTEPYNFYKTPFDHKKYAREAKLAIVVTGLGLAKSTTNIAIEKLPAAVTLSFSPFASGFVSQVISAREKGHETMVDLYLEEETANGDMIFSSPATILTHLPYDENLARARATLLNKGAVTGVVALGGSAFKSAPTASLAAVQKFIMDKGLIYLENDPDFPKAAGSVTGGFFLNANATYRGDLNTKDLLSFIKKAADLALDRGKYIIILPLSKATLNALLEGEIDGLFAGVVLTPLTALLPK